MRTTIAACLLALLLAVASSSSALGSDGVQRHGSCSGGPSEWELRVERESSTSLRVRFRIEGGAEGQVWQLFLSGDGVRIYAGSKESGGGGQVRVRKVTDDRDGVDRIKASGVNLATGESCAGAVRS